MGKAFGAIDQQILNVCKQIESQFALVGQALEQQKRDSAALLQQQQNLEKMLPQAPISPMSYQLMKVAKSSGEPAESSSALSGADMNDALQNLAAICQQMES